MQKQLDQILQRRMDRKDFLKHVAMGVALITGTAGIVKLLSSDQRSRTQHVDLGYGASVYGGRKTIK
jgi:hypothetical protein